MNDVGSISVVGDDEVGDGDDVCFLSLSDDDDVNNLKLLYGLWFNDAEVIIDDDDDDDDDAVDADDRGFLLNNDDDDLDAIFFIDLLLPIGWQYNAVDNDEDDTDDDNDIDGLLHKQPDANTLHVIWWKLFNNMI